MFTGTSTGTTGTTNDDAGYTGSGNFTTSTGATVDVSSDIVNPSSGETNNSGGTITVMKTEPAIMVGPDGSVYEFNSPQEVPDGFTVFTGTSDGPYILPTYVAPVEVPAETFDYAVASVCLINSSYQSGWNGQYELDGSTYNNKNYWKKDFGTVIGYIYYSSSANRWELASSLGGAAMAYGLSDTTWPWDGAWNDLNTNMGNIPWVLTPGVCPDTDGDGVTDEQDVFPSDASESADSDYDGVGDNTDPDQGTMQVTHDSNSSSTVTPSSQTFAQGLEINLTQDYAHYLVPKSGFVFNNWTNSAGWSMWEQNGDQYIMIGAGSSTVTANFTSTVSATNSLNFSSGSASPLTPGQYPDYVSGGELYSGTWHEQYELGDFRLQYNSSTYSFDLVSSMNGQIISGVLSGLDDGPEPTVHSDYTITNISRVAGTTQHNVINSFDFTYTGVNIEADSDSDGLSDNEENTYGTDPSSSDTDGDSLTDGEEVNTYGTDPTQSDTDGDGMTDDDEVNNVGTDPTSYDDTTTDTDGDGLTDFEETQYFGTNPNASDEDSDGLNDSQEMNDYGTDPSTADSDGDGVNDGDEVSQGTDPNDPSSVPATQYTLVINGTNGTQTGAGSYSHYDNVSISATPDSGYEFVRWRVDAGGGQTAFNSIPATGGSFIMPANDVSLTAEYTASIPVPTAPTITVNGVSDPADQVVSTDSLSISWSDEGQTSTLVNVFTIDNINSKNVLTQISSDTTASSAISRGVTPGTVYLIQVAGINSSGQGNFSNRYVSINNTGFTYGEFIANTSAGLLTNINGGSTGLSFWNEANAGTFKLETVESGNLVEFYITDTRTTADRILVSTFDSSTYALTNESDWSLSIGSYVGMPGYESGSSWSHYGYPNVALTYSGSTPWVPASSSADTTPAEYQALESTIDGSTQTAPIVVKLEIVETEEFWTGNPINGVQFTVLDLRSFTSPAPAYDVAGASSSSSPTSMNWYGQGGADGDGAVNAGTGNTLGQWTKQGSIYTFVIDVSSQASSWGTVQYKTIAKSGTGANDPYVGEHDITPYITYNTLQNIPVIDVNTLGSVWNRPQ